MTLEDIERLVRHVEQRDIARFDYSQGSATIVLRRANAAVAARPTPGAGAAKPSGSRAVMAPAAGYFLSIHPLSAERFVAEGAAVKTGQAIAFLQVGPCLRAVTAPADGVVGPALAEEGALVGYGARLFAFT